MANKDRHQTAVTPSILPTRWPEDPELNCEHQHDILPEILRDSNNVHLNNEKILSKWLNKFPKTLNVEKNSDLPDRWILLKPELVLDYKLSEIGDSLFIHSGPVSEVKFNAATIDFPICNFGRLPTPPNLHYSGWKDSILISVKDTLLVDAFYVNFSKFGRHGKVLLDTCIRRSGDKVSINFVQVVRDINDSTSFLFWPSNYNKNFSVRYKCQTEEESYRSQERYRGNWYDPKWSTP